MTSQRVNGRWILFNDTILIPLKREDGSRYFFRKTVTYEEVNSYYIYDGENVYYHSNKSGDTRLVRANAKGYKPEQIIMMIKDRDITWNTDVHGTRVIDTKVTITQNWAVEWDGHNIIELCTAKPKMSYREIKNVIINEGGYIDDHGFIHAGSATNKVVEIK